MTTTFPAESNRPPGFAGALNYVREEVLEKEFTDVIRRMTPDDEVIMHIDQVFRQGQDEMVHFHASAVERLGKDYDRLQSRLDQMNIDKLDGEIDVLFYARKSYARKSNERNSQITGILREIEEYQNSTKNYLDKRVMLFEVIRDSARLFEKQTALEKRRLLDFVVSNSVWDKGKLKDTYWQSFDISAEMVGAQ